MQIEKPIENRTVYALQMTYNITKEILASEFDERCLALYMNYTCSSANNTIGDLLKSNGVIMSTLEHRHSLAF